MLLASLYSLQNLSNSSSPNLVSDVSASEMNIQMARDDEIDRRGGVENHAQPCADEGQNYGSREDDRTGDYSPASYAHNVLVQVTVNESVPGGNVPPDCTK